MNRDYIAPTAAMVDSKLAELGFLPLPHLKPKPYLSGDGATKAAILEALKNLAILTKENDVAVIYYIGHGNLAPSYTDLSLGVYDEPVGGSTGLRFTDLLGYLQYTKWFSSVTQIPHYLIVLDACLSGNVAAPHVELEHVNNIPTIKDVEMIVVPPKIAILTATEDGDDKLAYSLQGTNYSAFGYYFARALKEDWACSDRITPDGILTLKELHSYIKSELQTAKASHLIQAEMKPNLLNKEGEAFIAYDPNRHFIDGARSEVADLYIQPKVNQEASSLSGLMC